MLTIEPRPSDDEAAAILAVIGAYLADEAARQQQPQEDWHWSASASLTVQGLRPMRPPVRPTWGHVERLRRAGHGIPGILGL